MGVPVNTFFICALPRSRTAWLANYLTYGDSFCFHEPAVGLSSFTEMRRLFESAGRKVVGSADCGNAWIVDGLAREFPDCRFVVVRRPLQEVRQSMQEIGLPDNGTLENSAIMLDYTVRTYSHISLDADDLSNPEAVKMLCEYVGAPFDLARFNLLASLNVQVNPHHLAGRMTASNISAMTKLMEAS